MEEEETINYSSGEDEIVDFYNHPIVKSEHDALERMIKRYQMDVSSIDFNPDFEYKDKGYLGLNIVDSHVSELQVNKYGLSKVSFLIDLKRLQKLDLGYNKITKLKKLRNLRDLKYLSLSLNQVSDISLLTRMSQLTELCLWFNHISDISHLAKLTNLQEAILWNNRISDISPLANLRHLSAVYLASNRIDYSLPKNQETIEILKSRGCHVET
jgi:Leucine-rich repeat (LRR) protein